MKKRSVLLAMGICAVIVMMSVVVGTVWFFQWDTESASVSAAQLEFDQLRARFAGKQPLLDMRLRSPSTDVNASRVAAPLHAFHTVIFDTRGGQRLVRISVPYWFGRHYARHGGQFIWLGELTFSTTPSSIRAGPAVAR
jgi:flagellar basal body-associated protein FliL